MCSTNQTEDLRLIIISPQFGPMWTLAEFPKSVSTHDPTTAKQMRKLSPVGRGGKNNEQYHGSDVVQTGDRYIYAEKGYLKNFHTSCLCIKESLNGHPNSAVHMKSSVSSIPSIAFISCVEVDICDSIDWKMMCSLIFLRVVNIAYRNDFLQNVCLLQWYLLCIFNKSNISRCLL